MTDFSFKTQPYPHQLEIWEKSRDLKGYALWLDMGTGKSKITIDTAAWLYHRGEIDCLIVIAPNGVHSAWGIDELPTHMPDWADYRAFTWYSSKKGTKKFKAEFEEAVKHEGLFVFVQSYSAVMTDAGAQALKKVLTKRRCLYVLDESARIKTPGSKRTKRILASSKHAEYRRVLTGTPVDNTPFDAYTQVKFIAPQVWADMGIPNHGAFKQRYGIWERRTNYGTGRQFDSLVRYQKLDELRDVVASVGSRLLKTDVLELPDKVFQKHYVELDGPQRRAYKELEKNFMTWLDGEGSMATADLMLVRMTRLFQLSSGFITDDDDNVVPVGKNVRLNALKELVEDSTESTIIFARWSWEIDQIRDWLGDERAVYYDGRTSDDDRIEAKHRFQTEGSAQFFVGKVSAAGLGLTLHRAKRVIFFSNTWSLGDRLQAEDRAHRAGMPDGSVTYIDLVAQDTLDEKLIKALREKRGRANLITGDEIRDWI